MNENDQNLINCIEFIVRRILREELIEFIVRRIVREELSKSNQNEINIEDHRDEIEDMICEFINNRVSVTLEA